METFPRQYARTRRFTVGAPRSFAIAPNTHRISYLQSSSGSDPINRLWIHDPYSQTSTVLADPKDLKVVGEKRKISEEERSRRERAREVGSGIVAFSSSAEAPNVAFTSEGTLYTADLESKEIKGFETTVSFFDPQISTNGNRVS